MVESTLLGAVTADDTVSSTVGEYGPTTDTWTQKTDMPTARSHAIGGAPGFPRLAPPTTIVTTVEEFSLPASVGVEPPAKLAATWTVVKAAR